MQPVRQEQDFPLVEERAKIGVASEPVFLPLAPLFLCMKIKSCSNHIHCVNLHMHHVLWDPLSEVINTLCSSTVCLFLSFLPSLEQAAPSCGWDPAPTLPEVCNGYAHRVLDGVTKILPDTVTGVLPSPHALCFNGKPSTIRTLLVSSAFPEGADGCLFKNRQINCPGLG